MKFSCCTSSVNAHSVLRRTYRFCCGGIVTVRHQLIQFYLCVCIVSFNLIVCVFNCMYTFTFFIACFL